MKIEKEFGKYQVNDTVCVRDPGTGEVYTDAIRGFTDTEICLEPYARNQMKKLAILTFHSCCFVEDILGKEGESEDKGLKTEFACVAEAVAYFYGIGYNTIHEETDVRIMMNSKKEVVVIRYAGFLHAVAKIL